MSDIDAETRALYLPDDGTWLDPQALADAWVVYETVLSEATGGVHVS
jgi:hypothetical protein